MTIKISLTSIPSFQFVSNEAAKNLAQVAKIVMRNKGDTVVLAGEQVEAIYIVVEGKVGVFQSGIASAIAELGPGQCIGEMSYLESSYASATIRALEHETKLLMLRQSDLTKLASDNAELAAAIFRGIAVNLSQKLRATTKRIGEELAEGRRILEQLSINDGHDSVELFEIPQEIVKQNAAIIEGLTGVMGRLEQLANKAPERAASIQENVLALIETRQKCEIFYKNMSRQFNAISAFLEGVERLINNHSV